MTFILQYSTKKALYSQCLKLQGMRESNSHQRFWRPLSYHLTNPLYSIKMTYLIRHLLSYTISLQKSIVLLLHCTFKTSYRFENQHQKPVTSNASHFRCYFGQALDLLVTVSSTCYHASTSALSTL